MSLAGLRYRNAGVFGGTALVVPPTSTIAITSGWEPVLAGSAIGVMTVATVVVAPVWGSIDDRPGAKGLFGAAALAASGSFLLFICAVTGFDARVVIPALCVFGAASGGLDPLVSARIQRSGWMHGLPRIRMFGVVGWCGGLVICAVLSLIGLGGAVFLVAAVVFVTIAVVEVCSPVLVPEARSPLGNGISTQSSSPRQYTVPGGLILFVLVGLPIPVSAYSYLIYSSSILDPFASLSVTVPFLTLIVLAALELPIFAFIGSRLEGRRLVVVYLIALTLLAGSWLPAVFRLSNVIVVAGLVAYTTAVALWTVAQVSAVRALTSDRRAGVAHTVVSAATKTISSVLAGAGVGWLFAVFGEGSVPVALTLASLFGLLLLCLATVVFPGIRSARIPCKTSERKDHVNSDR